MNVLAVHENKQVNFLMKNWIFGASDVTRLAYFLKASHILGLEC